MTAPKPESTFVDMADKSCEAALVARGFVCPRPGTILFEFGPDFCGWVGLNQGLHPGFLRVNPFVGIHCTPVMKLYDDLKGQRYLYGRIATFAIHLGEIVPDVDTFEFHSEQDIGPESARLADTIWASGLPYMRAMGSYSSLLPALMKRVPMLGGYPESVAATLYFMGHLDDAEQFVIDRRSEYEHRSTAVREGFEKFAGPFLELVRAARDSGELPHGR